MDKLSGYAEHIIFRNDENGYTVFRLKAGSKSVTCVGVIPVIDEGETLNLTGEYTTHAVYGRQFKINEISRSEPESPRQIVRYLGSGAVKGVGPALAKRIVDVFKDDTMRVIEEEPELLARVKGISPRMALKISEQVIKRKDMRSAMMYLQQFGISLNLAVKIYECFGEDLYRTVKENPYRIAERVPGVGFKRADEIAMKAGIASDSDFRVKSGLLYALGEAVSEGHVYLPADELTRKAERLLDIHIDDPATCLANLSVEGKIVVKREGEELCVYPERMYYLELDTAQMLSALSVTREVPLIPDGKIQRISNESGTELDGEQKKAVSEAMRFGVLVITGGPGTGKTTVIRTLIRCFESAGLNVALAAPTGRAAKRMTEATGREAKTVHRLLEISYVPDDDDRRLTYGKNSDDPLDADVVIIDEMSMVDLPLMHALCGAITVGTTLILVGDKDQLPSVGPGSVLKDIIASGRFLTVTLDKIFRQARMSDIVVNAHKINRGEKVDLTNDSRDFFFLRRENADDVIKTTLTLMVKKLPAYTDSAVSDIQVITPMRKGNMGSVKLNSVLQNVLNPPSPEKTEKEHGEIIFRVGDKVMQIRNNYRLEWKITTPKGVVADRGEGVFNGDIGTVIAIDDYMGFVAVKYDEEKIVEYPYDMLDELELAYAITIHKSQGSEYPAVIIPLMPGPAQLYTRNLLYTAVTRARKCVVIVGSEKVFAQMIENNNSRNRYTGLAKRLKETARIK